jgi:hypothetical protein
MKKKIKKRTKFIFRNEEFTSFKAMKIYAYFNMGLGIEAKGYELTNDEILKEYELIKKERRLLCRKTYDKEENNKKESEKKQLNLFNT